MKSVEEIFNGIFTKYPELLDDFNKIDNFYDGLMILAKGMSKEDYLKFLYDYAKDDIDALQKSLSN